jgi:hemerythrin-like domain-containing protein
MMEPGAVGAALEREHREIDEGIERFGAEGLDDRGRAESLRRAIDALRRHIYLEEEFLFPPMEAELAIPTLVMLREHGDIWRSLDGIEAKLDQGNLDDSLGQACRRLLVQLASHNAKEEPIFYGAARQNLSASESAEL